jgi:DNA primase
MDNQLRYDRSALVSELEKAGGRVTGTSVRCPFHEDKSASGSIHQDDAGVWRYTCHGGLCGASGDVFDIQARRSGKTTAEVLKSLPEASQTRLAAKYSGTLTQKKVYKTISDFCTSLWPLF